ncbi:hypothetical protein NPIL_40071 [Nephila pilipes]|uniref:Uncharacterized protein n=1 Tax=Nephila pilipes TaxID=299642 RepID=A0A8X6Q379_NEPPI|nr:hypothetical protein NPIL_40071 [Nephila pilipes]
MIGRKHDSYFHGCAAVKMDVRLAGSRVDAEKFRTYIRKIILTKKIVQKLVQLFSKVSKTIHVRAEPIYQAGMQRRDTLSRNTGKNTLETASPTPQGVVSLYGIRRGVAPHGSVPPAQSTSSRGHLNEDLCHRTPRLHRTASASLLIHFILIRWSFYYLVPPPPTLHFLFSSWKKLRGLMRGWVTGFTCQTGARDRLL